LKNSIKAGILATALVSPMFLSGTAWATQPEFICNEGAGWEDKVDTDGDPATVEYTAPDGFLVDAYCVKAGTAKEIIPVAPAAASVTIDHPDKDSVSHYQVKLVAISEEETTEEETTEEETTEEETTEEETTEEETTEEETPLKTCADLLPKVNITIFDPDYALSLDGDKDGTACEKKEVSKTPVSKPKGDKEEIEPLPATGANSTAGWVAGSAAAALLLGTGAVMYARRRNTEM
jgi:LPXTG-motif cell wall-anchored protein